MATKQTNEEMRLEVIKEDQKKDVNIYAAVTIAVAAGISSAAGAVAVLSIGFLETFRKDIAHLWLACIPFCFPVITGISIAYRKQLATVGVHIALVLSTTAAGGAGYGFTIEPVFLDRENCTIVSEDRGDCHREVLVYLYVICGGIAAGCAVLGLLLSFCACSSATKRRAKREEEKELKLRLEDERRGREVKQLARKSHATLPVAHAPKLAPAPALPTSPPPAAPSAPAPVLTQIVRTITVTATGTQTSEGETPEPKMNGALTNGGPHDNATTHL